jgi:hypothetical protein
MKTMQQPDPMELIYARAAETLAQLLPLSIRSDCDLLLGKEAGPHERWTMYDTALTHQQHRQGRAQP